MIKIIIVGPTAIGKTDVAVKVGRRIDAHIISADSRQIYRFMDIGTAKPPLRYLEEVKHYLVDIKDPCESFSAGEFVSETDKIIKELENENKNVIVVGGTGFYIDALVHGLDKIDSVKKDVKLFLDDFCLEKGSLELFKWLEVVDESWAKKINFNDCQRIKRGLSVFLSSGRSISEFFTQSNKGESRAKREFTIFVLYARPSFLKERILLRTEKMIEEGLVEETKKLLDLGFSDCYALRSVGYKEAIEYIEGRIKTIDHLISSITQSTLNYAKRQLTFFRSRFGEAHWVDVEKENPVDYILNTINGHFT